MSTEKHRKKQATSSTLQHTTTDSGLVNHAAKKNKKASKTSQRTYDISLDPLYDAVSGPCNPQRLNSFSRSGIVGMCNHIHREDGMCGGDVRRRTTYDKYARLSEINGQLDQRIADAQIDEMFIGGKCSSNDGLNMESKQFSDALEILKLKRSLFLQSLQFAKRDSEKDELFLERGINKQIEDSISYKKVKNQHKVSSNTSFRRRPSNKIVVLRPTPRVVETPEHVICSCSSLQSHRCFKSKERNVKPMYFFSFKEIKKRLRRATGDNQERRHWISSIVSFHKVPTRKGISASAGDKSDLSSRNGPEISTTDEPSFRKLKSLTSSDYKHLESDIFQEAKKHLSERLRKGNTSEVLENKQTLRTLGRILCSPEHDLSTPASPRCSMRHGSVSTEKRFSHRLSTSDDKVSPLITCASGDELKISETNDIGKPEDLFAFEIQPEAMNTDSPGAMHSPDTSCEGDGFNRSLLPSPSHDRISESSFDVSSSNPISPQEVANNMKDVDEHQSPVSVLDPLFMDDASSPSSITVQSSKRSLQPRQIDFEAAEGSLQPHRIDFGAAEGSLQPRRIDFGAAEGCRIDFEEYAPVSPEDPKIRRVNSMNEDDSISAYIRAVLQTSPSPDQILDTSFFHRDKLFQTKSDHDPQLLFDCVNDVLLEAYEQHFECSPWTSYLQPSTRAFPQEDHLVYEVVKDVKCLLLPQFMQPTLDQLVGHDIAKSGTWIDIRLDTEELVHQIAEDIIEESVVETILMLQC